MNLIDYIYFIAGGGCGVLDVIDEFANFFYFIIGGTINFLNVNGVTLCNFLAQTTSTTRFNGRPLRSALKEWYAQVAYLPQEVFLIDEGKKYADSNKMFLVNISVPDLVPPIIPPRPKTPDLSLIAHILF